MTGWVPLGLIGIAAFGAAWLLGVPRRLGAFVGAALMLGATGYALQGSPAMPAAPAAAAARTIEVDPELSALRLQMFGRHTQAESLFFASDALIRAGATRSAVALLIGGVRRLPTDAAIWTGLGSAYAANDGDVVSPASRFAFERAMRLAPRHPGPPFFLGLALVRAGELREARRWWWRAFVLAPDLSFRAGISERLALLDGFLASEAGQGAR